MPTRQHIAQHRLGLRVGDLVEVRGQDEILATLDESGRFDGLQFMPEMFAACGQRFRVHRRADKTCDAATLQPGSHIRRMHDTVHLEGHRCDGQAHGGCQAKCLTFWKEAWLRRVDESAEALRDSREVLDARRTTANDVMRATVKSGYDQSESDRVYSCQATEIGAASEPLPWWQPNQYVRDLRSGNISARQFVRGILILVFNKFQAANNRFLPKRQLIRGGRRYPFYEGKVQGRTPQETLNLQPGELVEIKSRQEIEETLNEDGENRGMRFGITQVDYCGQRARVLARVEKIIDDRTGRLITMKTPCIILDGVTCKPECFQFCPRAIYPYWREIWLRRVSDDAERPRVPQTQ